MSLLTAIANRLKKAVRKTSGNIKIEDVINSAIVSSKMSSALNLWGLMYEDKAPWLHEPTLQDPTRVASMGIPAFIASEKARTAVLEMKSEITMPQKEDEEPQETTGNDRANFLNRQYQEKVISKIRTQLEYGIAKGGLVIKPYIVPDNNDITQPQFEFDFIQADGFFPIAFDNGGKMTEAAFIQRKVDSESVYTRLEHHKLDGNLVTITNRAFKNNVGQINAVKNISDLGREIPLTSVSEWANIQPEQQISNVDRLLFAYFKMPEANTIDPYSPLGVSGYSRAVKLIKEADKQYSRLLWEFEGGELAVDIDRNALVDKEIAGADGKTKTASFMGSLQERLYRPIDVSDGDTYQVFSPALRDVSLLNGLNAILMRIEDVTALSRGTLSDVSSEAKTATELKVMKQRSYSANADIQKALENALRDVVYIMNVYCTLYGITPEGEYEVSFEWDDSILVDTDTELSKRLQLMQNGLHSKVRLIMWYYGMTKSQAKEYLAEIEEENKQAMDNRLMNDFGG